MEILDKIFDGALSLIPAGIAAVIVIGVIIAVRFVLEKRHAGRPDRNFRRQTIVLLLSFVGVLIIIIVLPLRDSLQAQLLSLIGILLMAAIALSSTTFLGNIMAGFMLRAVRNFRPGDFIRVGDHFGRVSEQGLFHVEIQTEDRDLTTMPNLYLVTNPVKVIRSSGTLITAEVSLGYDVPHTEIERLLLLATAEAGLQDGFVHILGLGDFSVTYRAAGLLPEVKQVLSARSRLRTMMLDKLHEGGIEIVSPTFMNQRVHPPDSKFIPRRVFKPVIEDTPQKPKPEAIVFDKAEEAESLGKLRERLDEISNEIETSKKQLDDKETELDHDKLEQQLEGLKARKERLVEYIQQREKESK